MERKLSKYSGDLLYEDSVVLQAIALHEGIMPDGKKVTYEQLINAIIWNAQDLQQGYEAYSEMSIPNRMQVSFILGSAGATRELLNYFYKEFREQLIVAKP